MLTRQKQVVETLLYAPLPTVGSVPLAFAWQDGATPPRPRFAGQEIKKSSISQKKGLKFKTIANRFNILLGNNDILLEYWKPARPGCGLTARHLELE